MAKAKKDETVVAETESPERKVRKVIKRVTQSSLRLTIGIPRAVKLLDAMKLEPRLQTEEDKKKKKEPPTMVNAVDLDTGETGSIMVNRVLHNTLDEEYPEQSYIGKCFNITMQELKKGKNNSYHPFVVEEIEE